MNKEEMLVLDVIPIYKNEIYPTKESIVHFKETSTEPRIKKLAYLINEIKRKFFDCDCIIILENGMVLEILKGDNIAR